MYVVATAGHVDHGKSTLIRALTGMEPDRWAVERSRGMSIDLGFCWTDTPDGHTVAFVDVPGHERYLANALAGVGPSKAVLLVVGADEGWMPQTAEHLMAADAFDIRHGVLAVTRADLADPMPAMAAARARLADTSLRNIPAVAVSGVTRDGVEDLLSSLDAQLTALPVPDDAAGTKLWIDRSFTARGAGTVVTGTVVAGTLHVGDEVYVPRLERTLRVRGLQCLGRPVDTAHAVARVAVNLRDVGAGELARGDALVSPGGWLPVTTVDMRHRGGGLPREVLLHAGTASVSAVVRPLGTDTVRLRLATPLPLHVADRVALRVPGERRIAAAVILDPCPPPLRRRGAARERAAQLTQLSGAPDPAEETAQRGTVRGSLLTAIGVPPVTPPLVGDWHVDPRRAGRISDRIHELVAANAQTDPLRRGMAVEEVRQRLDLPDARLVTALRPDTVRLSGGRLELAATPDLPEAVRVALDRLRDHLTTMPFSGPTAEDLRHLGLDRAALQALVRRNLLLHIGQTYLLPDAPARALAALRSLAQPFTASEAREALRTTRRVAIPLLEYLDSIGTTECLPQRRRRIVRTDL